MRRFIAIIDAISEWTAFPLSLLVIVMMLILLTEVLLRYVFHNPTVWGLETSQQIFAAYAVMGGAYVLLHQGHIKIDVFYAQVSPRGQAIIDSITYTLFFLFIGVMFVYGLRNAIDSMMILETSPTPLHTPVYPARIALALGALLMLLQGTSNFVRAFYFALRGSPLE